ncbi:MAG: transcriptional regulator [Bacteroidia bacterium]|nr:transcriptional regulator [Bacteroidia bacterium]HQV01282.1 transcriptional regulator [Bacteroidia bacterium]
MIRKLNKAFESRVRLGIMSALLVNEEIDFITLKQLLDVSDGNLSSHLTALETLKYIDIEKKFIGRKTNTTYGITRIGRKAFNEHIDALESIIKRK